MLYCSKGRKSSLRDATSVNELPWSAVDEAPGAAFYPIEPWRARAPRERDRQF